MSVKMIVDLAVAREMVNVKGGGIFEHNKIKYEIADNRELPNGDYELAIYHGFTYFVAIYGKAEYRHTFDSTGNKTEKISEIQFRDVIDGRVHFKTLMKEVHIEHQYKPADGIADMFKPDEVVKIVESIISGTLKIMLHCSLADYELTEEKIDRKNGAKAQIRVVRVPRFGDTRLIGTQDEVILDGFCQVIAKVWDCSYSIVFSVKDRIPSLMIHLDLGYKLEYEQKDMFNELEDKVELITIEDIKEDKPNKKNRIKATATFQGKIADISGWVDGEITDNFLDDDEL